MGIREHILQRLDISQRIVFGLFFGIALVGNIAFELWLTTTYQVHLMHLGLLFSLILVFTNPQGVRSLFFFFFLFILIKTFQPHYGDYISTFDFDRLLFSFTLYLSSVTFNTVAYFHIAIYALLAYFSLKNPFTKMVKSDSEVIDDFK